MGKRAPSSMACPHFSSCRHHRNEIASAEPPIEFANGVSTLLVQLLWLFVGRSDIASSERTLRILEKSWESYPLPEVLAEELMPELVGVEDEGSKQPREYDHHVASEDASKHDAL